MEVAGKIEGTTDGGHSNGHVHCELCQGENVKTKATGACRECEEYMCDTCFKHHLKAKACRNHVKISVSEVPTMKAKGKEDDVEKCKKHNDEVIKFYCRKHGVVGCGDCIILEHTNCKPEYVRDLAKSFRKDGTFKHLFKKIDRLESKKNEGKKKMKNNRKKIDLLKERALGEMKKFRDEINAYCDKAEAYIVSEVARLTSENEKLHNKMGQDMEALIADIEEMQKRFSDQQSEAVTFMNAVTYKPTIETIEQRYKQLQPEKVLKQFQFVRSEIIAAILNSAPKIGMLRIDSDVTEKETEREDVKKKEDLKTSDFTLGTRVRRGPDWPLVFGDQDGGGPGTVTGFNVSGWAWVKWDSGVSYDYRIGQENAFDLSIIYD